MSFPARHGPELLDHAERNLRRFERRELDPEAAAARAAEASGRTGAVAANAHAAVAITLLPDKGGRGCFLLTRRSLRLRRHRGQWALPGGRIDEAETPEEAAMRELHEEVGLDLDSSALLGRLDDFGTRSGFVITPVVFWCNEYRKLQPNPDEVYRAYRIPLIDLDRPDVPVLREIPESENPVLSMPIRGGLVHAPTAAIVYQMLEVVLRGNDVRVAHYEQPVFAWR